MVPPSPGHLPGAYLWRVAAATKRCRPPAAMKEAAAAEHERDARREHGCTDLGDPGAGVEHEDDSHRNRCEERTQMRDASKTRPGSVARARGSTADRAGIQWVASSGGDCGRAGWLQYGLDGRYLWVADDGDIVSAATNRVVSYVPALANSRYLFELDWRGGMPVRSGGRSGIAPRSVG